MFPSAHASHPHSQYKWNIKASCRERSRPYMIEGAGKARDRGEQGGSRQCGNVHRGRLDRTCQNRIGEGVDGGAAARRDGGEL